ncbi:MAG: hypothetical protein AB7R40_25455 [Nitrospiraceae bacterium]
MTAAVATIEQAQVLLNDVRELVTCFESDGTTVVDTVINWSGVATSDATGTIQLRNAATGQSAILDLDQRDRRFQLCARDSGRLLDAIIEAGEGLDKEGIRHMLLHDFDIAAMVKLVAPVGVSIMARSPDRQHAVLIASLLPGGDPEQLGLISGAVDELATARARRELGGA